MHEGHKPWKILSLRTREGLIFLGALEDDVLHSLRNTVELFNQVDEEEELSERRNIFVGEMNGTSFT